MDWNYVMDLFMRIIVLVVVILPLFLFIMFIGIAIIVAIIMGILDLFFYRIENTRGIVICKGMCDLNIVRIERLSEYPDVRPPLHTTNVYSGPKYGIVLHVNNDNLGLDRHYDDFKLGQEVSVTLKHGILTKNCYIKKIKA